MSPTLLALQNMENDPSGNPLQACSYTCIVAFWRGHLFLTMGISGFILGATGRVLPQSRFICLLAKISCRLVTNKPATEALCCSGSHLSCHTAVLPAETCFKMAADISNKWLHRRGLAMIGGHLSC